MIALLVMIGKLIIDSECFLGYFCYSLFFFNWLMQVPTMAYFFDITSNPSLSQSSSLLKYLNDSSFR